MEQFPLYRGTSAAGELHLKREGETTWFQAECRLSEPGIFCAWAVGDQGELRLGVLETKGGRGTLQRRFSRRMTAPLGRVLRGEIRPAAEPPAAGAKDWEALRADTVQNSFLREGLRGRSGVLSRIRGGKRELALPYDPKRPFPFLECFCFARSLEIQGRNYVVFLFDHQGQPVFP